MARILLAEDEFLAALLSKDVLEAERHIVDVVGDGAEALSMLACYSFDLMILDIEMPNIDGLKMRQEFRGKGGTAPVLILAGRGTAENKVDGLDLGADDYLGKPYHAQELCSRVQVLLRRNGKLSADLLQFGSLILDSRSGKVQINEKEIKLVPKEYQLLQFFRRHRNQLFSAQELLNKLWPLVSEATDEGVRSTIARIRKKIDDQENGCLQSIYALDYHFGGRS